MYMGLCGPCVCSFPRTHPSKWTIFKWANLQYTEWQEQRHQTSHSEWMMSEFLNYLKFYPLTFRFKWTLFYTLPSPIPPRSCNAFHLVSDLACMQFFFFLFWKFVGCNTFISMAVSKLKRNGGKSIYTISMRRNEMLYILLGNALATEHVAFYYFQVK